MRQSTFGLFCFGAVMASVASGGAVAAQKRPAVPAAGQGALYAAIDTAAERVLPKVVNWRRDFHEHPELGNSEVRTAKIVAEELRSLGFEVKTGVAKTGVVGLLRGGRPGPVVALRSDMDALPVSEEVDLPFKSKATALWAGQQTGVMHACGHDNHMAILLGAAHVLASLKPQLSGSVKFIFQPAEEGPPPGEEGGAELMVKEGVLEDPKVDAIFGLHVFPYETGTLAWRPRGIMAAGDRIEITVTGRQTHGAQPWAGVDPIVTGSQIVMALQTLVSRQADLTLAPAILTIGAFNGGNRHNIIPNEVKMLGTLRTYDKPMREMLIERIRRTVALIAQSAGATAEVAFSQRLPVTYNDPALTTRMDATLRRVAGSKAMPDMNPVTPSEDFSYYQEKVPGVFFFLGVTPKGTAPADIYANHSPRFFADEAALVTGVRAMSNMAVDYLTR
ncbi:MAG: amidohydrolase [Vicinamibacteria bacterium]|nr:amidohydrolase [Vicinamibacteria bacterium]